MAIQKPSEETNTSVSKTSHSLTRRQFFKLSAAVSGGLGLSMNLIGCSNGQLKEDGSGTWQANAWVELTPDGKTLFILDRVEMGQGTLTGLTTLLAEEMDVLPESVVVKFAPAQKAYRNPDYGLQITGGSNSLSSSWQQIREAGAVIRTIMKKSAARVWQKDSSRFETSEGRVIDPDSGLSLEYKALFEIAANESVPWSVELKSPDQFKVIGKQNKRLDAPLKVTGKANFGIDTRIDNMLYSVVVRSPAIGGKIESFNSDAALKASGVRHVVEIHSGVAIVADSYWQARKAASLVEITWQENPLSDLSNEKVFELYRNTHENSDGESVVETGDFDALAQDSSIVSFDAEYQAPFLAHATMEPQNCVARVTKDRCDIWAPTQGPDIAQVAAAKVIDLDLDQIFIHTTFIGGGFGRRLTQDYVAEAAEISSKTGESIKLVWSREDDTKHDLYRPASLHRLSGSIDSDGNLVGYHHHIVCPKIMNWYVWDAAPAQFPWAPKAMYKSLAEVGLAGEGIIAPKDHSPVEGAEDYAYQVANVDIRYTEADAGVPISYWRSVGHSQNAFVVESFMDEMAEKAGKDSYQFKRSLLSDQPRGLQVLDKVAEMSAWQKPSPEGVYKGISVHKSFGTWVAQVVELQLANGDYHVSKVYCAVDCGLAVNPDIVHSQMESGVIFALTAVKYGQIDIEKGQVQQSNFHDYQILRNNESPEIEVAIIASTEAPTGVGEPSVPPLAPAVAAALFKATGKRFRSTPFKLS